MECLAGSVIPNHYTCRWLTLFTYWHHHAYNDMHDIIFPTDIYFFWLCQDTNPSPSLDFTWYVWFSITIASLPHRQPIISVVSASRPDCQLILRHFYLSKYFRFFQFSDQIWNDLDEWKGHLQSKILKAILFNIRCSTLPPYHFVICQRSHFHEFCFKNQKKMLTKQRLSIIIHNLSLC